MSPADWSRCCSKTLQTFYTRFSGSTPRVLGLVDPPEPAAARRRLSATAATAPVPISDQPAAVGIARPRRLRKGLKVSVETRKAAEPPTAPRTGKLRFPSDQPASRVWAS